MAHLSPACSTVYSPFLPSSQHPLLDPQEISEPTNVREQWEWPGGEADGAPVVKAAFLEEEAPGWALKDGQGMKKH